MRGLREEALCNTGLWRRSGICTSSNLGLQFLMVVASEAILFQLQQGQLNAIGRPQTTGWILSHAEFTQIRQIQACDFDGKGLR